MYIFCWYTTGSG